MINTLLKIAHHYCRLADQKKSSDKTLLEKIVINGMKVLCMLLITIILKIKYIIYKHPYPSLDPNGPVVSMTSFPARLNDLWMVLDSIYNQTVRPSKILLNLTRIEFPKGMDEIPSSLKKFLSHGLDIVFVDENLRPHNKYFNTLKNVKDRIVITLDDDLYYWRNTIESLMDLHIQHPNAVCANHTITINFDGEQVKYSKSTKTEGNELIAQGVTGVLYPTNFRPSDLFDTEVIKKLCLTNDDPWLRIQEIRAGVEVYARVGWYHPLELLRSQRTALWHKNQTGNVSSQTTSALIKHYNMYNVFKKN